MRKCLIFYEDNDLYHLHHLTKATSYVELMNKIYSSYNLHTNETSALDFKYLEHYDFIIIVTKDFQNFYFTLNDKGIVEHNTDCQKELRLSHNFRKLWLANYFTKRV